MEASEGKPLFIPNKEELLRYEDCYYYKRTPQVLKLENFLKNKKGIVDDQLSDVMSEIVLRINIDDNSADYALCFMAKLGINFTSAEFIKFEELMCDMENNFRMHANRGYTPCELSGLVSESQEHPTLVLSDNMKALIKSGKISTDSVRDRIIESSYPKETKLNLLAQLFELQGIKSPQKHISRNSPYLCGSGKKYKRCCGSDE